MATTKSLVLTAASAKASLLSDGELTFYKGTMPTGQTIGGALSGIGGNALGAQAAGQSFPGLMTPQQTQAREKRYREMSIVRQRMRDDEERQFSLLQKGFDVDMAREKTFREELQEETDRWLSD